MSPPLLFRRGVRYALTTGPNPLAGWCEAVVVPEAFPGESRSMAHKSYAVLVAETQTAQGERTMRPTVDGARTVSPVAVHWCAVVQADGQIQAYDEALEAEQELMAHLRARYPIPAVQLDKPGHFDDDKWCGGGGFTVDRFTRQTRPFESAEAVPAIYVHGIIYATLSHTYDWS